MRTENVEFFSDGIILRGFLRLPDQPAPGGGYPALVHGPGWLGLASANNYVRWHEGLTTAGYAVLAFDYRGFGDSEGERGWVRPEWQLEDILNAVTYLTTRTEIDANRLGAYGMGGTGGGNALLATAHSAWKTIAGYTPIGSKMGRMTTTSCRWRPPPSCGSLARKASPGAMRPRKRSRTKAGRSACTPRRSARASP